MIIFILNCNNLKINNYKLNKELEKNLNSYVFLKDKKLVLGSYLIKIELLKKLNLDSNEYIILKNEYGKPYFKSKSSNELINFNISHSNDFVILFYNNNLKVGVDLVYFKNNMEKTKLIVNNLSNTLSDKDLSLINDNLLFFFKIWAFKEAVLKYMGTGITNVNLSDLSYSDLIEIKKNNILNDKQIKFLKNYYYKEIVISEFILDESYYLTICYNSKLNNHIEFEYVTPII